MFIKAARPKRALSQTNRNMDILHSPVIITGTSYQHIGWWSLSPADSQYHSRSCTSQVEWKGDICHYCDDTTPLLDLHIRWCLYISISSSSHHHLSSQWPAVRAILIRAAAFVVLPRKWAEPRNLGFQRKFVRFMKIHFKICASISQFSTSNSPKK